MFGNDSKTRVNIKCSRVGFNVPPNIIGHIGDDFYGSNDPTNSVKALKDNSW